MPVCPGADLSPPPLSQDTPNLEVRLAPKTTGKVIDGTRNATY